MRAWMAIFITLFVAVSGVAAAEILSPFTGSTAVGTYKADFLRFH